MFGTRGISTKLVFSWRVAGACLGNKFKLDDAKHISIRLNYFFVI